MVVISVLIILIKSVSKIDRKCAKRTTACQSPCFAANLKPNPKLKLASALSSSELKPKSTFFKRVTGICDIAKKIFWNSAAGGKFFF